MFDWFSALPLAEQIFAAMALGFGSVLTVIMLLSLVGGDIDAEVDLDAEVDGAFSIKGILAFLTFLGFGAWIMLRAGSPVWLSTLVGIGTGYAMMSVLAYLITYLLRFDADGGRRAAALLAQEGEVYLSVPAGGAGVGRMQVRQGARLVEVEAVTDADAVIPSGSRARVVEVLGPGKVRVEAVDDVAAAQQHYLS